MVIEEPQAGDFWREFGKRVQMQQCDEVFNIARKDVLCSGSYSGFLLSSSETDRGILVFSGTYSYMIYKRMEGTTFEERFELPVWNYGTTVDVSQQPIYKTSSRPCPRPFRCSVEPMVRRIPKVGNNAKHYSVERCLFIFIVTDG